MSNNSDSSILGEDVSKDPSSISQIFGSRSKISLVKLGDDNISWKFQILTALEAYDLESYLESIVKPPTKYINKPPKPNIDYNWKLFCPYPGLGTEYQPMILVISARTDSPSVQDIMSLLLTQESQIESYSANSSNFRYINASHNPQMSAMVASYDLNVDSNWYPNLGATNHLIHNLSNLSTRSEYGGGHHIYAPNGSDNTDNTAIMYPLEIGTQAQTREESTSEGYDAIPLQIEKNVDNVIQSSSLSTHPMILDDLIKALNSAFALKDLGALSYFLRVEVLYPTNGGMFLSQAKYITNLLQKTKMIEAKPISTPMVSGQLVSAHQGENFHDVYLYRSTVGALHYATLTHPEISYSALSHGLWLRCSTNLSIVGFADADWASDHDDRKSTSGYCVYFGITLSQPLVLWCDNLSAVHLSANPILH
ncbi:putative mitochondrial protein [Cucumis melo var. makuwa]|uniref:Mitochondrial protein n=1 Tax=Cucumis melo var. makuwa TaxID=1194695 RepID=A0A5A7T077_CUCMM|nr:putative mitochondrial protein [Cucumis melo var. makuwa]